MKILKMKILNYNPTTLHVLVFRFRFVVFNYALNINSAMIIK